MREVIVEHVIGRGVVRHLAVDEAWCRICHPEEKKGVNNAWRNRGRKVKDAASR
jgi:hypothetical protein